MAQTGAGEIWVTHGAEDALVHWCRQQGLAARPLNLLGYGDEGDAAEPAGKGKTAEAADGIGSET